MATVKKCPNCGSTNKWVIPDMGPIWNASTADIVDQLLKKMKKSNLKI